MHDAYRLNLFLFLNLRFISLFKYLRFLRRNSTTEILQRPIVLYHSLNRTKRARSSHPVQTRSCSAISVVLCPRGSNVLKHRAVSSGSIGAVRSDQIPLISASGVGLLRVRMINVTFHKERSLSLSKRVCSLQLVKWRSWVLSASSQRGCGRHTLETMSHKTRILIVPG